MEDQILKFLYDDSLKDEFQDLDHDDSLLELGIIDSVKMMQLIDFIEKTFGITVDEDDMMPENFDSINAITEYIGSKK
ncbi:MAG: acyl carrier protein [Calditrichaeota bacterium]|nr:MAG: acyl carrier protein [Calditrichota bacterium]MBL1206351.1 acyl carrier protein [Calditrichota bacterium]NOG46177.1 acyl carrier protein [Calditrichota bacterium]